jgi:hypothetical protein
MEYKFASTLMMDLWDTLYIVGGTSQSMYERRAIFGLFVLLLMVIKYSLRFKI